MPQPAESITMVGRMVTQPTSAVVEEWPIIGRRRGRPTRSSGPVRHVELAEQPQGRR